MQPGGGNASGVFLESINEKRPHAIRPDGRSAAPLCASVSFAAEDKAGKPAASKTTDKAKITEKSAKAKKAAVPETKLVYIDSARKAELKTLPYIGDAEADKIIAGRPYGSKAHLVIRNIIPTGVYEGLKRQVIAKQKKEVVKKK